MRFSPSPTANELTEDMDTGNPVLCGSRMAMRNRVQQTSCNFGIVGDLAEKRRDKKRRGGKEGRAELRNREMG